MIRESDLLDLLDEEDISIYLEGRGYTVTYGDPDPEIQKEYVKVPTLPNFSILLPHEIRTIIQDACGLQHTTTKEEIIEALTKIL